MNEYIKEIAILIILSKVILSLVPKKEYYKYVKLFLGTIMIIFMMKPIDYIFDLSGKLEESIENIDFSREKSELTANLNLADEYIKAEAVDAYKEVICREVEDVVTDEGFVFDYCKVELEYDEELVVKEITVNIAKNDEKDIIIDKVIIEISGEDTNYKYAKERESIQSEISEKYNMSSENVIVLYEER